MIKKILTGTLVGAVMFTNIPYNVLVEPVKAAEITTVSHETQALSSYDSVFKIPTSEITSITNNAGNYKSSVISKAIDGDKSTHWETNKPNTATFKNKVTVTFKSLTEIAKLKFIARQDAGNKGFPQEYNLYYSTTDSGDNFKLLKTGKLSVTGSAVDINFTPTNVKRVQFEFVQAKDGWAAVSELAFYKEDEMENLYSKLFTDGTASKLTTTYNSIKKIEELERKIQTHPNRSNLIHMVNEAKTLIQNPDAFKNEIITLAQNGNTRNHAKNVLLMGRAGSDNLSTGLLAKPGKTLRVYVDVDDNSPLPKIVFTQQEGHYGNWARTFALKKGENIITVPRIYSDNWSQKPVEGGAIYFVNPYTSEEQGSAPKVRVVGAESFPYFKEGDNVEEFMKELLQYREKMVADPKNTVDIFEIESDRFVFTGNTTGAYKAFVTDGVTPTESIESLDTKIDQIFKFAGVDESSFEHSLNRVRLHFRLMQPYGAAYAADGHIGLQRGVMHYMLEPKLFKGIAWGIVHEIGHEIDLSKAEWVEITNNMWSNYMYQEYKFGDNVSYENIFKNQSPDNYATTKGFSDYGYSDKLAMFWQLQIKNNHYWTDVQKLYRERKPNVSGSTKVDTMILYSSEVMGIDLTEYYDRYKFKLSDDGKTKMEALNLPKLNEKLWYLHTDAYKYEGTGFTKDYQPVITNVSTVNNQSVLNYSIDQEAQADVLGYEIIRDGEIIGFTKSTSYTDTTAEVGKSYVYQVVAYDKKLKPSKPSAIKNIKEPRIEVSGSSLIALHSTFNPLSIVKAFTSSNEDITQNIKVISNDVNTEKSGTYEVTYQVEDDLNHTTTKTIGVHVVSEIKYLSDIKEKSAQVGYGVFRKDKLPSGAQISLLSGNEEIVYQKGLGTHAQAEVIYDVTNKDYNYFESFVGIDKLMRTNADASVKFQVWVDGVKKYESPVMKGNSNQEYVKVNIKDANEIKLVVDSNGVNYSDHAVWADAKFTASESKPVLTAKNKVYAVNETVNLLDLVTSATDVEDGDLIPTVETNYKDGNFGYFNVTFSITDSDGNTTSETVKIYVPNKSIYASDIDYKSANVGWGQFQKDKNVEGGTIQVKVNEEVQSFEKGFGAHATSTITYDLTDMDVDFFSTLGGVDVTKLGASVIMKVYVDGQLVDQSGVLSGNNNAKEFFIDLTGAKELKLVADSNGSNAYDHAVWADAKFLSSALETTKMDNLVAFAKGITSIKYVDPSHKFRDTDFKNIGLCLVEYENKLVNGELTQKDIEVYEYTLLYLIGETGQTYVEGGQPISFEQKTVVQSEATKLTETLEVTEIQDEETSLQNNPL